MVEARRLARPYHRTASTAKTSSHLRLAIVAVAFSLGGLSVLSGSPRTNCGMLQATGTPQIASDADLKQLRATEDAVLTTYGWIDRKNGIVRIPIDRAMDLLLQRGLPTRPPAQQP